MVLAPGSDNLIDLELADQDIDRSTPRATEGKFIFTATISRYLCVDNGIKSWHPSGQLLHVQDCEELYQTSWRPTPVDTVPHFPSIIPPASSPSLSVQSVTATVKVSPARPAHADIARRSHIAARNMHRCPQHPVVRIVVRP